MIGVSLELEAELKAKYTQEQIDRFFSSYSHFGELRLVYARNAEATDRTSPMPSSRHMQYAAKGWTAVELFEEVVPAAEPVIELPREIQQYAEGDRMGVWRRGDDEILSSCRHALSLIGKGFRFSGLADEGRLRAVAEARPWPPPAEPETPETQDEQTAASGRASRRR